MMSSATARIRLAISESTSCTEAAAEDQHRRLGYDLLGQVRKHHSTLGIGLDGYVAALHGLRGDVERRAEPSDKIGSMPVRSSHRKSSRVGLRSLPFGQGTSVGEEIWYRSVVAARAAGTATIKTAPWAVPE